MADKPQTTRVALKWSKLLPLALIAAGLIVYLNSLTGSFVFDDGKAIRALQNLDGWGEMVDWALSGRRAMLHLTLAANYRIDGDNVAGYHLVNVLIHMIGGLALYGVVRRTLLCGHLRQRFERAAPWLAFCVALIWLVHPLNTQAVTYIVQRGESMMGMFYLLTLYAAIRLIDRPKDYGWLIAAVAACAMGMATKEVMVTVPIMVVIYDRVFTRWTWAEQFRRRWLLYVLLLATWGWYPMTGLEGLGGSGHSAGFQYEGLTWWQYALTQPLVILEYLKLSVWPYPLVLDYMHPAQHTRFDVHSPPIAWWWIVWPVAVVALLLALTAWGLRRRNGWGFLGAWFFGILAVTSSVLPIADLMVEHRMYLPLAAVVTLAVAGGYLLLRRLRDDVARCGVAAIVMLLIVAGLTTLTIRRNAEYESKVSIWRTVIERRPNNPRGWHNLGAALSENDFFDEAMFCYERTLTLVPQHDTAHNGIGTIWLERGEFDRAIERFKTAVELKPDDAVYHYDLGTAYLRKNDLDNAERVFRQSIELRADYAPAYNNLGVVLVRQGRLSQAFECFRQALRLDSNDEKMADKLAALAVEFGRVGRFEEAVQVITLAITVAEDAGAEDEVLQLFNRWLRDFQQRRFPQTDSIKSISGRRSQASQNLFGCLAHQFRFAHIGRQRFNALSQGRIVVFCQVISRGDQGVALEHVQLDA
ncbi:MAG: tetratricopeptide repeat protein, partial [Phycisphaeraceae bacterium]